VGALMDVPKTGPEVFANIQRRLRMLERSKGVGGFLKSVLALGNTVVVRDEFGRTQFVDPVLAQDAATKASSEAAADAAQAVALIPIGGGITWWGTSDPASPGGGVEYAIPDGRALSRATYAVLFALWGTAFGAGNGTTTFNIPNAKGRVQVGRDSADTDFDTMGETRGAKTHLLTAAEMPSHSHVQNSHNHGQNSHNHGQNSHNHTQNSHDHKPVIEANAFVVRAYSGTTPYGNFGSGGPFFGASADTNAVAATNQAATAVNQAATATNQAATATNQNTGGGDAHNNLQPSIVANTAIRIR